MRTIILYMRIFCPYCGTQHIDEDAWSKRIHRIHLCANCEKEFDVTIIGVDE